MSQGEFLGIKYKDSTEWRTTRQSTQLHILNLPITEKVMLNMRNHIANSEGLKGLFSLFKNRQDFTGLKEGFKGLSEEEKVLYMTPFLTTIDTFVLNLSFKSYGEELKDFFDYVPVKFVPMTENDELVICRLKNNGRNNPGNSVFGPTGVVCPGSNVTTNILRSIKDFCHNSDWEVEGTPIQNNKMVANIHNKEDVKITFF